MLACVTFCVRICLWFGLCMSVWLLYVAFVYVHMWIYECTCVVFCVCKCVDFDVCMYALLFLCMHP